MNKQCENYQFQYPNLNMTVISDCFLVFIHHFKFSQIINHIWNQNWNFPFPKLFFKFINYHILGYDGVISNMHVQFHCNIYKFRFTYNYKRIGQNHNPNWDTNARSRALFSVGPVFNVQGSLQNRYKTNLEGNI